MSAPRTAPAPDASTPSDVASGEHHAAAARKATPSDAGRPSPPATGTAVLSVGHDASWISGIDRPARSLSGDAHRLSSNKLCPSCGSRYPDDFNVCPRDATPLRWPTQGDEDPFVGTTLAETYRVVRALGEGGMGRVYEVHHTRLPDRRFALKMLHPEFARQPELVQRFQREAETASRVKHPNVIDVFDVGRTPDGRPYLVSELLEGEDLGALLKREAKFDVGLAVHIVRQVCSALAAAHELSVIHRDVKPENLFVGDGARPRVKILDFGISKLESKTGTHLTRTGVIMGTPAYMAPEQARGERVDFRADIYAVGAILYRLLTGRTPFEETDPSAAITAVLTQLPPRPRSIAPEIPEALELVIERAMAKNPLERFGSMRDFDAALERFDRSPPFAFVPVKDASGDTPYAGPPSLKSLTTPRPGYYEASGAHDSLARTTREAQWARPVLVVVSLLSAAGLVVGLTECSASAIALLAKRPTLDRFNAAIVLSGVIAFALTPFALYVRHVVRIVWRSSVGAIRFSRRLRTTFLVGAATYGAFALLVRFFETVVSQSPQELAWAGWGVLWFAAALLASGAAAVFSRFNGD